MKRIIYKGPDRAGVHLETGVKLPHGAPVYVGDTLHAELLDTRPDEFADGEGRPSSSRKAKDTPAR